MEASIGDERRFYAPEDGEIFLLRGVKKAYEWSRDRNALSIGDGAATGQFWTK